MYKMQKAPHFCEAFLRAGVLEPAFAEATAGDTRGLRREVAFNQPNVYKCKKLHISVKLFCGLGYSNPRPPPRGGILTI